MGLFRLYGRAELSWEEIGKIGLKSAKNFVKGMFCDENGFSLTRTLTTASTIAGVAAVAAIPGVGPAIALTGGAALGTYTAYKGTSKVLEGKKEYCNAKTHEEAVQAMEKAMDGGVETGVSILALLGIRQCAAKMSIKAKTATKPQSGEQTPVPTNEQMPVSQKTHQPQTKPVENIKTNNVEKFYNKSGSITQKVRTDINGKKMTVEYKYDKDGFNIISQTETCN